MASFKFNMLKCILHKKALKSTNVATLHTHMRPKPSQYLLLEGSVLHEIL